MANKKKHLAMVRMVLAVFCVLTAVSAASETKEEKKERLRRAKIIKNTADSFVIVHYHFKKSERPKPADDDFDYGFDDEGEVLERVLAKRTKDVAGVIVSKDGKVFTVEDHMQPDVIDKITVTGRDGQTLDARRGKILTKTTGQTIRITGAMPESWKALKFVAGPKALNMKSKLYSISLKSSGSQEFYYFYGGDELEGDEYFSIMRGQPIRKRSNQSEVPDYLNIGVGGGTNVICDSNGSVLGVTANDRIELASDAMVWRGSEVLSDPGIGLLEREEAIREQFSKYLYQVKITFRPPPKEDEEYDMGMFGRFYGRWYGVEGEDKEMFVYGLAFTRDKLLLPLAMPQQLVAAVDTIAVEVKDEYREAKFGGVLKEMEGTVIDLNDTELPEVLVIDSELRVERVEPFWTVFARELVGKDLVIGYNRWTQKSKGYENKLYRRVEHEMRNGSWLLDKEGRFAGVYTGARREYQRVLPYLMGESHAYFGAGMMGFGRMIHGAMRSWRGRSSGTETQVFDASMLASIQADLPAHYDSHIKHLSKDEQKRRMWLGVEFTGVSKEMAKQLDLRRQTEDGRIGLMINRIYPDSPAARMGLVEGDVLLKLRVREGPWPIELKVEREYDMGDPDWEDFDVPEEFEAMGWRPPRKRPWSSRDNFFTRMLGVIGEGESAEVTYLHEGKELKKEFVIEQSPRDALSAKKYKDRKIGLTVKNLTYEVRTALKLSTEEKAIVVSKVEPGTPAALARINAFELIRAVDGQEMHSVDEFESAIKKAKEEGKQSVRITVEWMGKTRLADLKFEAKGSPWKDMMKMIPGVPGEESL
jgi:hypothetical protein